jgi:two-component system response regulator FixJ
VPFRRACPRTFAPGLGSDRVFLDYDLPDGDGLTFLRGVRAAGIAVPIVVLRGQRDGRLAAQLASAGAADSIPRSGRMPSLLISCAAANESIAQRTQR